MPMSRYEIRNEYSLADPELYRAADKDDPEALLEGVAMAGLVGLLRQLGDLAEFAAEIFHDLHEEVMVTASRGHGLMVRVQQLESEVPSIEKAFLSQIDHSSFLYSAGVDWHPNLRMDQNLVTQGDLPRFVMDSYEECRGPPRLFLLDKFDVAGAGACLKRYTDPSFFKVEPPMMTSAEAQREKKIRKAKKKGSRFRNGGTPEVLPTSHAKLHQLFLEERVENGVSKPARRVTLKRRLSGFPFDTRTGKSYMEKLLRSPSPEHKVLHEVTTSSSQAMLPINNHNEAGLEVVEFRSLSPERESMGRKRSPPDGEEITPNPSIREPYEIYRDDEICDVSNSYPSMVSDEISSRIDNVNGERDMSVGGESKIEGSLTGYESDGIASEVDNYVDAPSTIGSEIDTDSELRVKSESTSSFIKTQRSYANADLRTHSSDSQSTGERTMSDEGNNSSKKETSSFCSSGSPSTSAENPPQDKFLAAGLISADVPDIDLVDDASSCQKIADEDLPEDQHLNHVVTDDRCTSTDAITSHKSDFEALPASFLCSSDTIATLAHSDSEVPGEYSIREPELEDKATTSDDEDRNVGMGSPSVSDSAWDDYLRSSAGEHVDEELNTMDISHIHAVSENLNMKDSSITMSANLLHEDGFDHDDLNLIENTELSSNTHDVLSPNTSDTLEGVTTESLKPDKLDDECVEFNEEFSSERPEVANNVDSFLSISVPTGEKVKDELDEDSNLFTQNPEHFPYIVESSHGKDLSDASLVTARNGDVEELDSSYFIDNQLSSENLMLQDSDYSSDRPEDVTDAHEGYLEDVINENPDFTTPRSCEVVDLSGLKPTDDLSANDSAATKSSCSSLETLEEPGRQFDNVENTCITSDTNPILEVEVDKNLVPADMTSLNESACVVEQSETADMASLVPEISDNTDRNSSSLLVSRLEVEEHTPGSKDSDMDVFEDDFDSVVISHRDLGLVDGVRHREGTSDSSSVSCNDTDDDHLNLEVPDSVPYPDHDSNKNGSNFDAAATLEVQGGLDEEKGLLHQSGSMIDISDASTSPPDLSAEKLPGSGETSLGLLHSLSVDSHQMPDHDDRKEDNSSGSIFSLANYPSPPSSSDVPGVSNYDSTVSESPTDLLGSTFPPSNLSYETTQINLDELPPLPPLPPVQWRMGKFFQGSAITGGDRMKDELFPAIISPPFAFADASSASLEEVDHSLGQNAPETAPEEKIENRSSSLDSSSFLEETDHSLVQIAPETAPEEHEVEHGSSSFASSSFLEETGHSAVQITPEIAPKEEKVEDGPSSLNATVMDVALHSEIENELLQPTPSTNAVCSSPEELNHLLIQSDSEKAPVSEEVGLISSNQDACDMSKQVDLQPEIENMHPQVTASLDDSSPPLERMNHSMVSTSPQTAPEQEKVQQSSSSEGNAVTENKIVQKKVENEQLKLLLPFTPREIQLPAEEDGASNGVRPKLPRPRNPLVDDVAALDKSKLRKVSDRVRPPIEKVDERDSLLEQIRNKSFNLKPAMASRPSIRGPRTNLKVAAILEKANQIRQALAGSDEDDDDNWSDS